MKKLLMICVCALLFGFSVFSPQASAAGIKLAMKQTKYSLEVGKSVKVGLSVSGTKLSKVKWKSSSNTIVTVNQSGTVKGVKVGSAKVTAYLPNTKYSAVTTITVSKKALTSQEVFQKVNPSIVYIELYDSKDEVISTGSGIITQSSGIVVTNFHVVTNFLIEPSYVVIELNTGKKYKTDKVVSYDPEKDLAVLKIDGASNLKAATLGDSSKVKTGEKSYALGSPLGINNTITEGIVSNKSVKLGDIPQTYIQSTAPLSSGNSGGALVNRFGEVIGVNVATIDVGQNMNLAIPINDYKKLKITPPESLLSVNRKVYVPISGEGDILEEEPNDDELDAKFLEYKINHIKGTFSSNEDVDIYGFVLTGDTTVKIKSVALDSHLEGEFAVALIDIDGKPIWSEDVKDPSTGKTVSILEVKLEAGIYFFGLSPYIDTTQTFSNSAYNTTVEFVTQ